MTTTTTTAAETETATAQPSQAGLHTLISKHGTYHLGTGSDRAGYHALCNYGVRSFRLGEVADAPSGKLCERCFGKAAA